MLLCVLGKVTVHRGAIESVLIMTTTTTTSRKRRIRKPRGGEMICRYPKAAIGRYSCPFISVLSQQGYKTCVMTGRPDLSQNLLLLLYRLTFFDHSLPFVKTGDCYLEHTHSHTPTHCFNSLFLGKLKLAGCPLKDANQQKHTGPYLFRIYFDV